MSFRTRWATSRWRIMDQENRADDNDRRKEQVELEQAARVPDETEGGADDARETTPQPVIIGRIMTKEERNAALQALINSIPSEKEELLKWPVKWDFLDNVSSLFAFPVTAWDLS